MEEREKSNERQEGAELPVRHEVPNVPERDAGCAEQANATKNNSHTACDQWRHVPIDRKIEVWLLGFTLVAAVTAAWAALGAFSEAKRSTDAVVETLNFQRISQRAFIDVEKTRLPSPVTGKPFPVTVFFRNTGQYPAYDITDTNVTVAGLEDAPEIGTAKYMPLPNPSLMEIGPGSERNAFAQIAGEDMLPVMAAVAGGTESLYVYGRISYRDFIGWRRLYFCKLWLYETEWGDCKSHIGTVDVDGPSEE